MYACLCVCVCLFVVYCKRLKRARVFLHLYRFSHSSIPTFAFYMYRITSFNHCTPKIYTHNTNAFASLASALRIQMCTQANARARASERRGNEAEEVKEKKNTHTYQKYPKSEASERVKKEFRQFNAEHFVCARVSV